MSFVVHIDYLDDDTPTVEQLVVAVPRIGEKVGVRLVGPPSERAVYLDTVVDVRHYRVPGYPMEIRVLTSSRS